MPRLFRPGIPLDVRCRVALRQLGEFFIEEVVSVAAKERRLGALLAEKLERLAALLGCTVADFHLDHDPPLAARPRSGDGKETVYVPKANDPAHLFYRPHGPEFAGSHLIKTNVRGDHGQYPDRVLIKRERKRRQREANPLEANVSTRRIGKAKKSRPLRSASRWPPRGSRKFSNRRKK